MTGPYLPPEVQALEPYVDAGVFGVVEVHVVTSLLRSMPAGAPAEARSVAVVLALALAVRAPLHGHVRAELGDVAATVVADGADGGDGAAPGSALLGPVERAALTRLEAGSRPAPNAVLRLHLLFLTPPCHASPPSRLSR